MYLFKTEDEREKLIKEFSEKADSLSSSLKGEIPFGTKVTFETVTTWDDPIEVENPDEEGQKITMKGGKILACFIKQPHLMTAVVIMDKLQKRDSFSAGLSAWDAMVIPYPHSCKEIEDYNYKLGLVGRLGFLLDGLRPDIKKN